MNWRLPLAGVAAVLISAAAIGCGSSGSTTSTDEFQIDVPGVNTTTGGEIPGSGTGIDPSQPDTKENDLPPAPGSPQEAFEKFCNQHPDACG